MREFDDLGARKQVFGMIHLQPLPGTPFHRTRSSYEIRGIDAQHIKIIADVDSMHFSWLTGGKTTGQVAQTAATVGADAVAIGDPDEETTLRMITSVRENAPGVPIILAGYTNHRNAERL